MAPRVIPSKGRKSDKVVRDALLIALNRESENHQGVRTKRLQQLAEAWVTKAIEGDVYAMIGNADRVEGKPAQQLVHSNDEDSPILADVHVDALSVAERSQLRDLLIRAAAAAAPSLDAAAPAGPVH